MKHAALLVLLCSISASAIEIQLPFNQLVADADSIFLGRVVTSQARWDSSGASKAIVTEVEFAVERVYKGRPMTRTTLRFLGGAIGGVAMDAETGYRFQNGERVVLFVGAGAKAADPLVGGSQGLYRVVVNPRTKMETVRPSHDDEIRPVPLRELETRIVKALTRPR